MPFRKERLRGRGLIPSPARPPGRFNAPSFPTDVTSLRSKCSPKRRAFSRDVFAGNQEVPVEAKRGAIKPLTPHLQQKVTLRHAGRSVLKAKTTRERLSDRPHRRPGWPRAQERSQRRHEEVTHLKTELLFFVWPLFPLPLQKQYLHAIGSHLKVGTPQKLSRFV